MVRVDTAPALERSPGQEPRTGELPHLVADRIAGDGTDHDDRHHDLEVDPAESGQDATYHRGRLAGNEEPDHEGRLGEGQRADEGIGRQSPEVEQPTFDPARVRSGRRHQRARGRRTGPGPSTPGHRVSVTPAHVRRRHAGHRIQWSKRRRGTNAVNGVCRATSSSSPTAVTDAHDEQRTAKRPRP